MLYNNNVIIKNVYMMLVYTYKADYLKEFQNVGSLEFENLPDLYIQILLISVPMIIKEGIIKDYIRVEEDMNVVKGKLNINQTLKRNTLLYKQINVEYDQFSEDVIENQIIKATLLKLTQSKIVSKENRKKLRSLASAFSKVELIELSSNSWDGLVYHRNNIRYRFILEICKLIFEDKLLSEEGDSNYFFSIWEKRLPYIFESFIVEFFKRESFYKVSSPHIPWLLDDDYCDYLPRMESDLILKHQSETLIIDTKFYTDNMQSRNDISAKNRSNNMYQIFTYINNYKKQENEEVSGMLLYVRTLDAIQPNNTYKINGKNIHVLTIDLNQSFELVKKNLLLISEYAFKISRENNGGINIAF